MTSASCTSLNLLLEAFALPEPEAFARWKLWRETEDLEHLDPALMRVLPMVAHGRPDWLAGDPARTVIQGLCRRAWTQNQLAFRTLERIVTALRQAGAAPVVLRGAAAFALLCDERKSIRPVESLELLVRREQVQSALDALAPAGWKMLPDTPPPAGAILDTVNGVWLAGAAGDRLKLSWRLLPCAPELARDRERLPALRTMELPGARVELFPPEEMLMEALLERREDFQIDWRWDALAVLSARRVDWRRIAKLMEGGEPEPARFRELRDQWKIAVPESLLQVPTAGPLAIRIRRVQRDYRWNAWNQGVRPSLPGLAAYCLRRWWRVFIQRERVH